jgi:hypothetical protein
VANQHSGNLQYTRTASCGDTTALIEKECAWSAASRAIIADYEGKCFKQAR